MGVYVNSIIPYEAYREMVSDTYFVDKSLLIEELIPALGKKNRYFCITRPRRFGKSVMASMVGAFFEKGVDSSVLFDQLAIARNKNYVSHLNKHNVIFIDFSRTPRECRSYEQYINRIQDGINEDLASIYEDIGICIDDAVWDVLQKIFIKTGDKFIFVMDEWDAVFHMQFISEDMQKKHLLFLKNLLKDQEYVEFAYMTGVLPIACCLTLFGTQESVDSFVDTSGESLQTVFPADASYSSSSGLNMFGEYDLATKQKFSEYFGFLEEEVDKLYKIYRGETKNPGITREDLRIWYDGYCTMTGKRLYNPYSIVCALENDQIGNYWTRSGPYNEIFYYIRNNIEEVQNDLVLLAAGEGVRAEVQNYTAVSMRLDTKDEIYSAMVVYGLLTYENGKVFIPNREIMEQFRRMLMTKDSLGYVYRLARESEKMLKATLAGDTETMARILKFAHDTEAPIFSYNSEIELSAVVNLVYLAARDEYRVEREDKAGEGYVDFIFYPERRGAEALILELKINGMPEDAIQQIKNRKYALRLKGKLGEAPKYTGRILAVGISYNKETKEHFCKVEVL